MLQLFEKTKDIVRMKSIVKLVFTILLGVAEISTIASANSKKGYQVFLKTLKKPCSFTGVNSGLKFAFKHTQDEWETIKQAGKFRDEVIKICPKYVGQLAAINENNLYDFSYEYASDSGNIPRY